ncbi:MAG: hypothetical protein P0Y55_04160 [Candidatus Cohnella colombiensis]|uniref:Uncharacterized protein n=1 Tax=Candidatus Cohnella colombiensis TaxID=3121368 RepID=A0AA95F5K0_9BACL|nr:MAG: hypothetical protein P0Y55_04160 [Cohnella sp.]
MNQTIIVNNESVSVSFTNYYDSVLGEFLFQQVMCDVFMPSNEVVPIAVEKEQIRLIVEAFKRRKELHQENRKEDYKGQAVFIITPKMRYDLRWLKGPKPKRPLTKEAPPKDDEDDFSIAEFMNSIEATPVEKTIHEFTDTRRKHLLASGFKHDAPTNKWIRKGIRFPDSKIDVAASDEQFVEDMARLVIADEQSRTRSQTKK